MQVNVKTPQGILSLQVTSDETVLSIKQKIKTQKGLHEDIQQLQYCGIVMEDRQKLEDYSIKNQSELILGIIQPQQAYSIPQNQTQYQAPSSLVPQSIPQQIPYQEANPLPQQYLLNQMQYAQAPQPPDIYQKSYPVNCEDFQPQQGLENNQTLNLSEQHKNKEGS